MKHPTTTDTAEQIDWPVAIVENLLDAVVVIDAEGIVQYVNPAAHRLAGKDAALAPGQPAAEALAFTDPEDQTPLELPSTASFRRRRHKADSIVFTHALFAPTHQAKRIVNVVCTPIHENRAHAAGVIVRFRDVTETVEEERKRRDKQKIEAISTMAASIASEFTNWLGLIAGHAAAIMDNLIPRTRAYEEAASILDAAKRANGLTKRLLSVARASDERQAARREPIDLEALLHAAVTEAETIFAEANISIKVKPHGHIPLVLAEGTQLFDCLINLFRNATDAMPRGGTITVDFPTSARVIPYRDFVLLRIRDTGRGMEKTVLEHAFDPFFTTKGPTDAIGLGLTVVQTSVEQWGGMVKIRSRPGKGTSVRLFLPAAADDAAQRRHGKPAGTILAVDDQEEQLNDICASLSAAGYHTRRAHTAEEFLAIYKRHMDEIDLVIVDVIMPGKDGKHVLDELLQINPQANVIVVSGFSRDYVRNYLKRGAWGFVQKPIDRDHLTFTVERMLTSSETS